MTHPRPPGSLRLSQYQLVHVPKLLGGISYKSLAVLSSTLLTYVAPPPALENRVAVLRIAATVPIDAPRLERRGQTADPEPTVLDCQFNPAGDANAGLGCSMHPEWTFVAT